MRLKMSSAKCCSFRLGLNVLTDWSQGRDSNLIDNSVIIASLMAWRPFDDKPLSGTVLTSFELDPQEHKSVNVEIQLSSKKIHLRHHPQCVTSFGLSVMPWYPGSINKLFWNWWLDLDRISWDDNYQAIFPNKLVFSSPTPGRKSDVLISLKSWQFFYRCIKISGNRDVAKKLSI